jgi:Zn-dependent peptidase ImmA (M78 family)
MTKTLNRMADLYSRLSDIGFPPKYVREVALPDWWCDEFEQSDGAAIDAASYAARRLNLDLDSLLEQGSVPSFKLTGNPKFKTIKGSDCNKFKIATALCNRVAELVSAACINDYQPIDRLSIQEIRNILISNNGIVSLDSVLGFCWQRGIPVFHYNKFPKNTKKFHGMVTYAGDRPVIVISLQDLSPSRLLFILVHEIGHIYKGHVSIETGSMIDEKVDLNSVDEEEVAANEVAGELLFGRANTIYHLSNQYKGERLANCAKKIAERDRISPGLIAWNYGWEKNKKEQWGITRNAVSILEPASNAPLQINQYLQDRLDWDRLSDDSQDHLNLFLKLEGN